MQSSYVALGIMSGTSLDGVDLAMCKFNFNGNFQGYQLISAATFPYPADLYLKLKECIHYEQEAIKKLDVELGTFYAEKVNLFLANKEAKPHIIASHGHTVSHRPVEGITLQIGNGQVIADLTGIKVVNDFRSEDVSLGGQGAPLVPVGDNDLFYAYDSCLNLGGIANISYKDFKTGIRKACDITPCNLALNHLSQKLGQPYDSRGFLAKGGAVDETLVSQLNALSFYDLPSPKSLGKEWFEEKFLPLIESSKLKIFDVLASTTHHIAWQISEFINNNTKPGSKLLLTGGGTYNAHLVEKIESNCWVQFIIPDKKIIEYKEAMIFAYLGILRIRGKINVLASVTGAKRSSSSGTIIKPHK